MECGQRKFAVPALCLLEAENVRHLFSQEAGHEINPQTDRIDVPGGKGETHAGLRDEPRPIDHANNPAARTAGEKPTIF
jgi:hypothetical protein